MADEIDFLVQFSRTLCISLPRARASVAAVKQQLQAREGVPADLLDLYANGKKLVDDAVVPSLPMLMRARLSGGLRGGKGGFGAMLRSSGKGAGAKATTNFGACRDLNGRRLRHVNQDIAVQKWRSDSEVREQRAALGITDQEIMDDETPSGIPGWYLATPSWADSVKKSHMKRRRNTVLCRHWLQARSDGRTAPPRAPRWWGCPRGRDCDYAHGEDELRGAGLTELKRQKKEAAYQRKQQALASYVDYERDIPDDMSAAIREGMRQRSAANKRSAATAVHEQPLDEPHAAVRSSDAVAERWLAPLGGDVGLTFERGLCELRGASNFGTATAAARRVTTGKWYYEVRLVTAGVIQLGWADGTFSADSAMGDGVGDHARSWAFDGHRQLKWTAGTESAYGAAWAADDVIGCLLDLDAGVIAFSQNGGALGTAFDGITCLDTASVAQRGFFPAISVEQTEIVLVNIGAQPFLFAPDGYEPVVDAIVVDKTPATVPAPAPMTAPVTAPVTAAESAPVSVKATDPVAPPAPIDLSAFESSAQLEQLGLDALKHELQRRGLKCGGSLAERAARLLSVRGKDWNEIESKLKDPRAARK